MSKTSAEKYDIIIIGGGLAGLTNAIHLSLAGRSVLLVEKNQYPKHKVCGEYISNEVLPYLRALGVDPFAAGAVDIQRFELTTAAGKTIKAPLPLGGFGISRYTLDNLLLNRFLSFAGAHVQDTVERIDYVDDYFEVHTRSGQHYQSTFVIGAYGKRSNLDVELKRAFIQQRAPYLGVKAHYRGDFPEDLVALHHFSGGYCGVSKVEDQRINICYLANFATFKKYKDLDTFRKQVIFQNPRLREILQNCEMIFDKPLTISQVSFLPKPTVDKHILMSGDSAGMIHPLCGNGMGMAIHSALLLSDTLLHYFNGKLPDRNAVENHYTKKWTSTFRKRLLAGRLFNTFFYKDKMLERTVNALSYTPTLLPFLIRQTHGKALKPKGISNID